MEGPKGIGPTEVNKQKTWLVTVEDDLGQPIDLTQPENATTAAGKLNGTTAVPISFDAHPTRGAQGVGIVGLATADNTATGDIEVRTYVGAPGSEEFLWQAWFKFRVLAAL